MGWMLGETGESDKVFYSRGFDTMKEIAIANPIENRDSFYSMVGSRISGGVAVDSFKGIIHSVSIFKSTSRR